jgi:hypothetical protein
MIKFFFYKNGEPSKTAFFLSLATIIVLFLYLFQSLFAGTELAAGWTIPSFSPVAAATVLTTLSGLYTINHGLVNRTGSKLHEQVNAVAEQISTLKESMEGKSNDS